MDTQTDETIKHHLVAFLYDSHRRMEAEWATGYFIDDKNTIQVYGKAPHRPQDSAFTHLCQVPLVSFRRYVQLRAPKVLIRYKSNPTLGQNIAGSSQVPPRDSSPVADVIDPPTPPSNTPASSQAASQTASPLTSASGPSSSDAGPR